MIAAELIEHLSSRASERTLAERSAAARGPRDSPRQRDHGHASTPSAAAPPSTFSPRRADSGWDVRALPGEMRPRRHASRLQQFALEAARGARSGRQALLHPVETALRRAAARSARRNRRSRSPMPRRVTEHESMTVAFATEGGQFQRAGWSTVVCGPRQHRTGSQAGSSSSNARNSKPAKPFSTGPSRDSVDNVPITTRSHDSPGPRYSDSVFIGRSPPR